MVSLKLQGLGSLVLYLRGMREDLLHFVWKHRKLPLQGLKTSDGQSLAILEPGLLNIHSGPDFFNARIQIGNQLWAGNVEIHVRASDWYQHNHQLDTRYGNVILHVVWEEDVAVYRTDQSPIPSLELRDFIPATLLKRYRQLFEGNIQRFINCEDQLDEVDPTLRAFWLERLFLERLEARSVEIDAALKASYNDWEEVFYRQLLTNFGLNVNGAAFQQLARAVPVSIIRKIGDNAFRLESLLFGMAGLLRDDWPGDAYLDSLRAEYRYLCHRFNLKELSGPKLEFARLRPSNFPTIRLSQFAALYAGKPRLFSKLMEASTTEAVYAICTVSASAYWDSRYSFGKVSGIKTKTLSKPFINLLLINSILPVKFCFARHKGRSINEDILAMLSGIPAEKNGLLSRFAQLGISPANAWESQGLLQLYRKYCRKNRCLHCAIGCKILDGK